MTSKRVRHCTRCISDRALSILLKQDIEIAAGEGPLERLGGLLVALLEAHQLVSERGEIRKIVGSEELALDNGEIDLDLIEPTGVDRGVDKNDIGPFGAQPSGGALTAVRGAIVDDPEHAAGRPIRLLAHDLGDQAIEGDDASFATMTAGGKMRWSATARVIFEATQSVSVETLPPLADDLAGRIQASANGIIGQSLAGQQHDLGPDHVAIGRLIFARPSRARPRKYFRLAAPRYLASVL